LETTSLLQTFAEHGALAAAGALMLGALAVAFAALQGSVRASDARRRVTMLERQQAALASGAGAPLLAWLQRRSKVLGALLRQPAAEGADSPLRLRLRQAGYGGADAPVVFAGARIGLMLAAPIGALAAAQLVLPGHSAMVYIAVAACATGLGFIAPSFFLDLRIARIKEEMRTGFPDMLDLLVVCMESGLSFEGAFERVSGELDKAYPHLREAMAHTLRELRAGKDRAAALFGFAQRLALDEARMFANMILQAEQLGSGVANALRVCADEMRSRRLLKAEEYANALPVMLVLPLGVFIFPAILVVTLLPAGIAISQTLFGPTP
jgi:tight adherence protein C